MPFVLLATLFAHGINVVVLALVLRGLAADSAAMLSAYGPDTPARRILACIYLAILIASTASLIYAGVTRLGGPVLPFAWFSLALFMVQIVYKLATAFAVGPSHPVVVANLAIVATHLVACGAIVLALRG